MIAKVYFLHGPPKRFSQAAKLNIRTVFWRAYFLHCPLRNFGLMGSYSIGEALNQLLEKSNWKPKVTEVRMRDEWEAIVGKTIARYTRNIYMKDTTLTIYTDVAALKQELLVGREQLVVNINEYFKENVVSAIVIR
jgi:predicted nucleic acid-binding Zn ribbon protein